MSSNQRLLVKTLGQILPRLFHSVVLNVPLEQRAKFEGWFKIELAAALHQEGFEVRLERTFHALSGKKPRADVAVRIGCATALIMLKTVNTNFRFPGVETRTRPITMNIAGVISDIGKLKDAPAETCGFVAFPVFPVAVDETKRGNQLEEYITRITESGATLVISDFQPRQAEWGISWYVCEVEKHG